MKNEDRQKLAEEIGLLLREARKSKQKSQAAIAKELGVSKLAVLKWEKAINIPSIDMIVRLEAYFGDCAKGLRKIYDRLYGPGLFTE